VFLKKKTPDLNPEEQEKVLFSDYKIIKKRSISQMELTSKQSPQTFNPKNHDSEYFL